MKTNPETQPKKWTLSEEGKNKMDSIFEELEKNGHEFHPESEEDILEFERKYGIALPEIYRYFLLKCGGICINDFTEYEDEYYISGLEEMEESYKDWTEDAGFIVLPKHLLPISGDQDNEFIYFIDLIRGKWVELEVSSYDEEYDYDYEDLETSFLQRLNVIVGIEKSNKDYVEYKDSIQAIIEANHYSVKDVDEDLGTGIVSVELKEKLNDDDAQSLTEQFPEDFYPQYDGKGKHGSIFSFYKYEK